MLSRCVNLGLVDLDEIHHRQLRSPMQITQNGLSCKGKIVEARQEAGQFRVSMEVSIPSRCAFKRHHIAQMHA